MSAPANGMPRRRGACPGLSAPMQTGDGLLARFTAIGIIPLDAFVGLCAAARQCGNGVIEITARGSIQVRGLSSASAPRFAGAIATLGITRDGPPILTNPLAGLVGQETLDAATLAADLRRTLAGTSLAARLAPKVCIAIDGGGALNLDELAADLRLRAAARNGERVLDVSIGGDGASAVMLGTITPDHVVAVTTRLLEVIARRGHGTRARDIVAAEGMAPFREALADLLAATANPGASEDPALNSRRTGNARAGALIGRRWLRDGSLACGVGLAFGHADALLLEQLIEAAATSGASGICAAPGRVLIAIGLTGDAASTFSNAAERLGFIVRADDARRYVTACAGAPVCASAHIEARAMAPGIAAQAGSLLGEAFTVHVSGCAKGCAHPSPAALTIVGMSEGCGLIAGGSARDAPHAVVPTNELPAAIAELMHQRQGRHG
jgi:precorrin-3B synthase